MRQFLIIVVCFAFVLNTLGQDTIKLPLPQMDKGQPLMKVFSERKSSRSFLEKEIPMQEVASLLWAANGINRPESMRRTVPTSQNKQEIEIYMSNDKGLFRYDAQHHVLITIHNRDIRALTGMQAYVAKAPVNIVIVADLTKMAGNDRQVKLQTASIDAGFVSQNIYLYCASEKLATVVRGSVDRDKLASAMQLPADTYIVVAQTVGYAGEE